MTTPEPEDHEASISAVWEYPRVAELGSLLLMGAKVRE